MTKEEKAIRERDGAHWNAPRDSNELDVRDLLQEAMKKTTPGRVVGLMAGLFFAIHKEADEQKDEVTTLQAWAVAQILDHMAFAIERIYPSD